MDYLNHWRSIHVRIKDKGASNGANLTVKSLKYDQLISWRKFSKSGNRLAKLDNPPHMMTAHVENVHKGGHLHHRQFCLIHKGNCHCLLNLHQLFHFERRKVDVIYVQTRFRCNARIGVLFQCRGSSGGGGGGGGVFLIFFSRLTRVTTGASFGVLVVNQLLKYYTNIIFLCLIFSW